MKIVCTSGYFNPIHKGHIELLKAARKLGDLLIVIVDNDKQVKLKGSKVFMDQEERMAVVKAIRYVDSVVLSEDNDRTCLKTLKRIHPDIFAKGGDSEEANTPELDMCKKMGIEVVFNVGGEKIQSSSWLKRSL